MGLFKKILNKITGGATAVTPTGTKVKKFISEQEVDSIVLHLLMSNEYEYLKKFNNSINYWQAVIKAIISAESAFNSMELYYEKDLGKNGIDPYTNKPYYSEGLMQLSYSDKKYYGCNFNWQEDKNKLDYDPSKGTFDPVNNISCGLSILNKIVRDHGTYIFNDNNYWAVLKPNNSRHKEFLAAFAKYNK